MTRPRPYPPDPDALAQFVEFYRWAVPRLVALLRWQGAPLPDATDCVQETMAEAYYRWATVDQPYGYCRTAATREWIRRASRPEYPTDDPEGVGVPLLRPDAEIATFEARHDVLQAIDGLPDRQRQVVALSFDGATPTEIAGILAGGITPDAVRASLHKARLTLRRNRREDGDLG